MLVLRRIAIYFIGNRLKKGSVSRVLALELDVLKAQGRWKA